MAEASHIDYSQTRRIVLLLDLNPLLSLRNPTPYLTSLLSSAKTLLFFLPLSNSLFSFKLFFSSLSPLLSSSTLLKSPNKSPSYNPDSLSFNHPLKTFNSLSETLNSLSNLSNFVNPGFSARASFTANSMLQITHDYAWELKFQDPTLGTSGDLVEFDFSGVVPSNLVVMFSPICRSLKSLYDYMGVDVDIGRGMLSDFDAFYEKFSGIFGRVRNAFVGRDIHCSWVDVRYGSEIGKVDLECDETVRLLRLFESGIKRFGWGFCSTDSIILGSALVPFALIYPVIGVSSEFYECNDYCMKSFGMLNLKISDVSGEPLECKCCDLQLFETKMSPRYNSMHFLHSMKPRHEGCGQSKAFWELFGDGFTKIDVKSSGKYNEVIKIEGSFSDVILVHGFSKVSMEKTERLSDEFFGDMVLEILLKDISKFVKGSSAPSWSLFLNFLYRRDYCALVSVSAANGSTRMGILMPFTIHSALLSIIKSENDTKIDEYKLGGVILSNVDTSNSILAGESRRRNKQHSPKYKDLSWSSFCKAAYEHPEMELEEAYFSKGCVNSKKLKFMRCWMKQVDKKCNSPLKNRLRGMHEESEQPQSSVFLAGKGDLPEPSKVEATRASGSEASEGFLSNLPERIEDGIQSGLDLATLAHWLVNSCVRWLNKKLGVDIEQCELSDEKSEDNNFSGMILGELNKVLLKDPKYFAGKHEGDNSSFEVWDVRPTKFSVEERVREYSGNLGDVIHSIYEQMDLLLFDDEDEPNPLLNSEESSHSWREKLSENDGVGAPESHSAEDSFSLRTGADDGSTDKEKAKAKHARRLAEAQERRQRAWRFSSFTRGNANLQRVWAPKQSTLSRSMPESLKRRCERRQCRRESDDRVCETPMTGRKSSRCPGRIVGGEEEPSECGNPSSSGSVCKSLFSR
ncbi:hypothetical protein Nepgr_020208 [Nepenthes gracilis]|uniref:LIM domain protein n=1 Tax=Nepenthes gracilis TaxID=150966 RepID=A0AAD3SWM7_NEPGR|nr:hypothetical protein Nepgr_020208 [Nepenthes gracilis]